MAEQMTFIEHCRASLRSDAYQRFADGVYGEESDPALLYAHHLLATETDATLLHTWTNEVIASGASSFNEAIAANPLTDPEVLNTLAADITTPDAVRYWLAKNPNLPNDAVAGLYQRLRDNPYRSDVVPSIAVALAARADLDTDQLEQLRAVNHWRVHAELCDNPVVHRLDGHPVTAWFMTPLSPAYHPGGAGERVVTINPSADRSDTADVTIEVTTPRHGTWTVVIDDVDWVASNGTPWVYGASRPGTTPAMFNTRTRADAVMAGAMSPLEQAARILGEGRITVTGLQTNHVGTVTGAAPEGVTLIARSGAGILVLHATRLFIEPLVVTGS